MSELGKLLVVLGSVLVVVGLGVILLGRMNLGKVAGGYCLSREEGDVLFSTGDFGGGERGVVDFDISGWKVEAVIGNRS